MVAAMRPFVQAEAETATKGEWPLSSPWNVLRRLSILRTIRIIEFPFSHQLLLISFLFTNYYYYQKIIDLRGENWFLFSILFE